MLRRTFIWSTPASILALGLAISGCTTTSPSDTSGQQIDKRHTIDAGVDSTLARLYGAAKGSRELVSKAHGVLTFPSVIDAGFVVGGQYGEGSLRVGGRTAGYYSMVTGSIGWQIGAQSRAIVFLFMTDESLNRFRSTGGWSPRRRVSRGVEGRPVRRCRNRHRNRPGGRVCTNQRRVRSAPR